VRRKSARQDAKTAKVREFFFALFAPWREKKVSRKAAKTAKVREFFFALFAPWREKKVSRKAAKTAKVISGSSLRPLRLCVSPFQRP
jgi:hypothetical protein